MCEFYFEIVALLTYHNRQHYWRWWFTIIALSIHKCVFMLTSPKGRNRKDFDSYLPVVYHYNHCII